MEPLTPTPQASTRITSTRITSIDALRGLTIAFMILVNDPGDWAHTYAQLDHAKWNGWTLTDLVFPSFLFLVGCSIVFSTTARLARGASRTAIALTMFRRAFYIFLIKMFITAFPTFHNLTHLRLFGVLTRIALCFLAAGLIFLYFRSAKTLVAITVAVLLGYWILMRFVPVPGLGHPIHDFPFLDPDHNLAAWIDRAFNAWCQRWLHTGVLYEHTRDPEGLLSTLPSIATTLIGVLAGLWLGRVSNPTRPITQAQCRNGLLLAGVTCFTLGELWSLTFPINKNLWTSSYVLLTGGLSLVALGLTYWLLDSRKLHHDSRPTRAVLWPLLIFGSNAIVAFALSNLIVKALASWHLPGILNNHPATVWAWLYWRIFARNGSTENTSLAFALAFVLVCFLPCWLLWRRKLFLRV